MNTVKEISKITGISIRTLRYYDEIGLLKPTELSKAGYRLYDQKALERLQQILFFRELEIPLKDIKNLMDHSYLDKEQLLAVQKSMLEKKRNRLNGIIELISDVMKGVNTMSFNEFDEIDVNVIIENMKKDLSEEQFNEFIKKYGGGSIDAYQEKLKQTLNNESNKTAMLRWYGSKEKIIEGQKPIQDMESLRAELDDLYKEFSRLTEDVSEEDTYFLVARLEFLYKQMLNMDNARNFLLDLANEYLQNQKLAETQDDQYGIGTTKHVAKAIQQYYGV